MKKFSNVNELVNTLKPVNPVYCIRPDTIKNSIKLLSIKWEITSSPNTSESITFTLNFSLTSLFTKTLPTYPAPPVTTIDFAGDMVEFLRHVYLSFIRKKYVIWKKSVK